MQVIGEFRISLFKRYINLKNSSDVAKSAPERGQIDPAKGQLEHILENSLDANITYIYLFASKDNNYFRYYREI